MSDVVVVTSSGSGQAGVAAGNNIVSQVVRAVGGENETNLRAQALDCLNRVRMRLNKRDWHFMKTQAADITLVNGTRTYTLPTTFKSPSYAQLIDTAGKPDAVLVYQDDATFAHWWADQETTGKPIYYSLRNSYDNGLISPYPIPGASEATDFTLRVEYFKRIPVITDDATAIDLPEEVQDVLIVGGQACILRERNPESPAFEQTQRDYSQLFSELVSFDRRVTDETARFHLGQTRSIFGTTFIKI